MTRTAINTTEFYADTNDTIEAVALARAAGYRVGVFANPVDDGCDDADDDTVREVCREDSGLIFIH